MQKLFLLFATLFALTGCVHKMDIEQGNIITPEMVSSLHTGMTKEEVKEIMGTPMLLNTFDDDRVSYVYTFKPGHGTQTEKMVTLIFRGNRLKEINSSLYSR
ncbi:MAG: outer membrane protein assembly factor BamE [Gammaproteobacteria bacterium]